MTPKEKAKELVEKYDETLTYLESKNKAKQCALICVDELIELSYDTIGYLKHNEYWQEVKKEINKI